MFIYILLTRLSWNAGFQKSFVFFLKVRLFLERSLAFGFENIPT